MVSIAVTRVCIVFRGTGSAFFLTQSSLQAQSCERVANSIFVVAGSTTSLSIRVVASCLIGTLIGFTLQPARLPSYSALVVPTREAALRPEPGICGCGPCVCGEQSASQRQWAEMASEGSAHFYNIITEFAIVVCTCVILYC